MLTSKERALLRGLASEQPTLFQLGKEGVTQTFLQSCESALVARELIKLSVLKTSPVKAEEAGEKIACALGAEFVAAIGGKIILYRFNARKSEHVLSSKNGVQKK